MQPKPKALVSWYCLFFLLFLLRVIPEMRSSNTLERVLLSVDAILMPLILALTGAYFSMLIAHKRAGYSFMHLCASIKAMTVFSLLNVFGGTVLFLVSLSSGFMLVFLGSFFLQSTWQRCVLVRSDSIILLAENRVLPRADIEQIWVADKWSVLTVTLRIKGEERPRIFKLHSKHREEFCSLVGCTASKSA